MNCVLIRDRKECSEKGIFSDLVTDQGLKIATTLEHSYVDASGECQPKIPNGSYKCVRGIHQLHNTVKFETFEVTGVPGHTNILFHVGNYNEDSEGCILLGSKKCFLSGEEMIVDSLSTFNKFMALQTGVQDFILVVQG